MGQRLKLTEDRRLRIVEGLRRMRTEGVHVKQEEEVEKGLRK